MRTRGTSSRIAEILENQFEHLALHKLLQCELRKFRGKLSVHPSSAAMPFSSSIGAVTESESTDSVEFGWRW